MWEWSPDWLTGLITTETVAPTTCRESYSRPGPNVHHLNEWQRGMNRSEQRMRKCVRNGVRSGGNGIRQGCKMQQKRQERVRCVNVRRSHERAMCERQAERGKRGCRVVRQCVCRNSVEKVAGGTVKERVWNQVQWVHVQRGRCSVKSMTHRIQNPCADPDLNEEIKLERVRVWGRCEGRECNVREEWTKSVRRSNVVVVQGRGDR